MRQIPRSTERILVKSILSLLLAGGEVRDQDAQGLNRFAVIKYVDNEWVYSARRHNNKTSSYICQLQLQGLFNLCLFNSLIMLNLGIVVYIDWGSNINM